MKTETLPFDPADLLTDNDSQIELLRDAFPRVMPAISPTRSGLLRAPAMSRSLHARRASPAQGSTRRSARMATPGSRRCLAFWGRWGSG